MKSSKEIDFSRRTLLGGGLATAAGLVGFEGTAAEAVAAGRESRLPLKILTGGLSSESAEQLKALSSQITVVAASGDEEWRLALPEADVAFGQVSDEDLPAAKKLRWVQYGAAGVERVLSTAMVNSPVILTNAKGCYAPEIGEHVFGLLFALTRGIALQAMQMGEKRWARRGGQLYELRGMTMGIVGFGGIGRETARRAKAMDMRVVGADIMPMHPEQVGNLADSLYLVDGGGLEQLLGESDVIVSAAPHTRKSEGMFGEREFSLMKRGAYFINVSRGKLVQTPALVKALTEKRLAGAGLDVTDPEPLPDGHALWQFPNVIITPHTAGQSQFAWKRTQAVFVENVRRYINNLPLLNVVDKQAGY